MTEFVRDAAATAAIFGFFAAMWFGWAQERPPPSWRPWLLTGSVASLVTLVAGGLLVWRHWNDGTVFDEDTSKTFGIVVGIEFAVAGIGAGVLGARRHKDLIPAWIALVVGVHLFPVAVITASPVTHVVAALVTIAALSAIPVARSRALPVSVVIGVGAGTILLVSASFFVMTLL